MKQSIITSLKVILFVLPFTLGFAEDKVKNTPKEPTLQVVNINLATVEELVTLPSVGPAIAKRIVEFRQSNKGFQTLEELMNVKGIGPKTFEKMKGRIKLK